MARSTKYDGLTRMTELLRMAMECGARQTALYTGMGGASIGILACIYTRIYGRRHANEGTLAAYRGRYIKNLTKRYSILIFGYRSGCSSPFSHYRFPFP